MATFGIGRRRRRDQRWNRYRARVEPLEARTLLDADCFRISEYMTVNRSTILDADGDASDWIEIQNTCPTSANLAGWKTSDGESAPWTFPNRSLAGNGYLVVFASGKDRTTTNELHTNFSLENDTLTLTAPNGIVVSSFVTESSSRVAGVSFGVDTDGLRGFLQTATDGAINSRRLQGILTQPQIVVSCARYGGPGDETTVEHAVVCVSDAQLQIVPPANVLGTTLLYTTNGSEPSPTNPATSVYQTPLTGVDSATIRAAAFHPDWVRSRVVTRSVITYSAVGEQDAMNSEVLGSVGANRVQASFVALPNLFLTVDPADLHGEDGIFTHYDRRGRSWERPATLEYDNSACLEMVLAGCELNYVDVNPAFQVSAGLRVEGDAAAALDKKSLRLSFRSEYDWNDLPYEVFGDNRDNFEELLLVAAADDSWQNPHADAVGGATYLRNELLRRTARDMGLPVPRSRYVHLYLNGTYWGIYRLAEQIDEDFAADALRLSNSCPDSVSCFDILDGGAGGRADVVAGDRAVWDQVMQHMAMGRATDASYSAISQLVDIDEFIDYLLVHFYAGTTNWLTNDWMVIRSRLPGGRFKFVVGDSESGFRQLQEDATNVLGEDSPASLFNYLFTNKRFRWRFIDRASPHLSFGGVLFCEQSTKRLDALANELREPLIAEAARWGDTRRELPFTPDIEWQREFNWLRDVYIAERTSVVRDQLHSRGLFSDVLPPILNTSGGVLVDSFDLEVRARQGTVFYTLDGSDPRDPGSTVTVYSPTPVTVITATETIVEIGSPARAFVPYPSNGGDALAISQWTAFDFDDASWQSGVTGVGYDKGGVVDYSPFIGLNTLSALDPDEDGINDNNSVYIRVPFEFASDASTFNALSLEMQVDDGFIAYLNGIEVSRSSTAPSGVPAWNATATGANSQDTRFLEFDITPFKNNLVTGSNILAIHGLNAAFTSSDMLITPRLSLQRRTVTYPDIIEESASIRAAAFDRGSWSPLATADLVTYLPALHVSEIMFDPPPPTPDEVAAGFDDNDDFEFMEFVNSGDDPIVLGDVRVTDGVTFDFATSLVASLLPGEAVVMVRNREAFDFRYGAGASYIGGEYDGRLADGGERIRIEWGDLNTPMEFRYRNFDDDSPDPSAAAGGGWSLVHDSCWGNWGWKVGSERLGTPGVADPSLTLPCADNGAIDDDGDLDGDGAFTLADVALIQANLGRIDAEPGNGDVNGDRIVNRSDVSEFARRYFGYSGDFHLTAPSGLTAYPSDEGSRSAWLEWEDIVNPDGFPKYFKYNVYRNGLRIGTTTDSQFEDGNAAPGFTHEYEVAGVDRYGVESPRSTSVSIVPLDTVSALATGSNRVAVLFSTKVNPFAASNPANYHIDGTTVVSATMGIDGQSVILTTHMLAFSHLYRLHVTNVLSDKSWPIATNNEVRFSWGDIPFEQSPPVPVEVFLAGSAWTAPFYQSLATNGLGSAGVAIWKNGQQVASELPWAEIDTVRARFSESVSIGAGEIRLTGVDVGHYDVASFAYDPLSRTATWRLRRPIGVDRVDIEFTGATRDLSGNPLVVPDVVSLRMLAGDVDGDGRVNRQDVAAVVSAQFASTSSPEYDPYVDIDGNGLIDVRDAIIIRNRSGAILPSRDVVISEFVSLNDRGLADEDGDLADWIELHNVGLSPVDLGGWFLTDNANNLARWRFPDVSLAPGERKVVYASGKDRQIAGAELHTDFGLSSLGGFLALVLPDGETIASKYQYEQQYANVSYGRNAVGERDRYYAATTPGGPNPPENTVLVTEFMASNHVTLADEDGDYADWIEVYNAGPTAEHMTGWTLSDGGADWTFAPINLSAGEYRVIFASGNDRRDPEGELHATFRLSRAGEDVILTSPYGVATTPFNDYPAQRDDVSFGLSADFAQRRYFTNPTPGEANLTGFDGVLFSVPHGFYDEPFAVELSSEVPDATIRYTTNGSTPTASHGIVYTEGLPVFVGQTTTLRAVAYGANATHDVTTQTYVFLNDVLGQSGAGLPDTWGVFADYAMDPEIVAQIAPHVWKGEVFRSLPSLSLVMNWDDLFLDERGIYAHPQMEGPAWERPGSLERIDTTAAGLGFSTNGTVRIVGQPHTRVSAHMVAQPKLSFGVRFDAPVSLSVSGDRLFAASPATHLSSIYLRAGFEDSWTGSDYEQWLRALYGRDQWMRETQRAMGQPAVDGRFVHLYINGLYWGVYNATEEPSGEFAAQQYGGDPAEFDIVVSSSTGIKALAGDPKLAAWDRLTELASADLSDASAYAALLALVDIDNLIDYLMLDLYAYAGSTDVSIATKDPRLGWFAVRRRRDGERFQFFAWDNEVILGEGLENYLHDRVVSQEAVTASGTLDPYVMLDALRRNAEFLQRFADRAQLHLSDGGALSAEAATQRWIHIAETLAPTASTMPTAPASPPAPLAPYSPLQAEGARWGRHRRGFGGADSWETRPPDPNANPPPPLPPPPPGGFGQEDSFQRDQQLRERGTVLLGQLRNAGLVAPLPAPRFTLQPTSIAGSPPGVSPSNSPADGSMLTMSTPTGALYYTLDGSDPRLAGGGISPLARFYTSPVLVGRNALLTARAHSGNQWSAVVVAPLIVETAVPLRITEVMYHPADPPASSPYTDDDFEFLELTNVGTEAISLLGMRFVEGIEFDFAQSPIAALAPQERVVLVKNAGAFTSRYDTSTIRIAGEYEGLMNNGDDDLRIVDAFGQTVVQLSYRDAWYPLADGPGFALVVRDVESLPAELSPRNAWLDRLAVGQYFGGTPGAAETVSPGAVVISEVYAAATVDEAQGDWIELANTTDSDIDVGGWYLSDNAGALDKFTIPIGTTLAAHSHLVFFQVDARQGYALDFGLKQSGDDVFLTSADGSGNFGGHREQISFGSSAASHSLGRYANLDGDVDFVPLSVRTPGAGNAAPQIGMIVISELMYGPFSTVGAPMEFIELVNNGDQALSLGGWSLGDGVDYYFGPGLTLAPGGTIVVSGGAPSEFRTQYAVDAATQVVGPFSGRLNNGGERVALYDSTGTLVDQVNYGNESPWPMLADEYGGSLERRSATAYGNESRNWKVSPRGGTPGTVHTTLPDAPQSFPYVAAFDGGDLFSLPGWILQVTNPFESDDVSHAATWSLSAAGGAAEGQLALTGTQSRDGSSMQDAILSLDLTTVAGATNLVLDFQLRRDGTPSTSNFAQLYVSGDGVQWQPAGSILAPSTAQWQHYVADLDALLADAAIVADGDVFLRFRHHGAVAGDGVSLDDVRVSTLDLVGPQVTGFTPATSVSAPVGQVTLTFDEIVDGATFSPADVAIIGPTGEAIGVSFVHSADGLTWIVEFPSQQIAGVYAVRVGPDIRDTFGNAMGSSASIGSGAFRGEFQLAASTASTPYSENFDVASFVDLGGWSFAVENGAWRLATAADSDLFGQQLHTEAQASGVIGGSSYDAIVKLDVSSQSQAAPLGLQFDLWRSSAQSADDDTAVLWISGDGSDWWFVEGLTTDADATNPGSSRTITSYGFDLAQILARAEVAWDTDVWLRFSFATTSQTSTFALDNVRINARDVTGPQVVGWSANGQSAAPLSQIDVTFDVPVDAATFTAAQVRIRDPFGVLATPQSITSVDGETWTMTFAPQTVAGSYQVSLLPGVRDLTGIALNQDGDSVAGEAGDAFVGSFSIGPAQAMTLPHEETFDVADSGLLTGWSIFADPRGQWRLSSDNAPWQGDGHFVAETIAAGLGSSVQEATLRLDLSAMAEADDVYLEVWAKQIGSGSAANASRLFISGDGVDWRWIAEFAPPANRYTHYAFDVDELARRHATGVDGDVYFRFQHQAERVGDGLAIDGLRVGQGDASGPRIAAYSDVTLSEGVATIDVTFDRPVDASSFQPEDVLIYIGQREISEDVNVSASAIVARDDRTFAIVFTPPALGGAYTLLISPEIHDVRGVPLNQNADAVAASLAGDDQFSTVFVVDHPGQTIPYLQNFESGSFADLSGWSFRVMGDFEYGANTWEFSDQSVLGGNHDLVATQSWDCWTDHEAILKLDLADQVGATDLELDFWLQFLPRDNPSIRDRRSARVFLRGESDEPWIDVSFWFDLAGELKPPEGSYTQYIVDLDAVLAAHEISFDDDVYLMFNRRGFHKRSAIALDNIGVRRMGDAPAPAATSKLTPVRAAAPEAITQAVLAVGEDRRANTLAVRQDRGLRRQPVLVAERSGAGQLRPRRVAVRSAVEAAHDRAIVAWLGE